MSDGLTVRVQDRRWTARIWPQDIANRPPSTSNVPKSASRLEPSGPSCNLWEIDRLTDLYREYGGIYKRTENECFDNPFLVYDVSI